MEKTTDEESCKIPLNGWGPNAAVKGLKREIPLAGIGDYTHRKNLVLGKKGKNLSSTRKRNEQKKNPLRKKSFGTGKNY